MDIFSSQELNDSFNESKRFFEENELTISQVSYDIRSLELLLKKYCLNITFMLLVFNEVKTLSKPDSKDINMAHHFYEYVSWEVNEKENKPSLRIFYKKYGQLIVSNSEEPLSNIDTYAHSSPSSSVLLDRRPLVETPVSVRLTIYPYLPTFLKKLTDELSKSKPTLNFAQFQHYINEFEKIIK
jgi:hypothetical protein